MILQSFQLWVYTAGCVIKGSSLESRGVDSRLKLDEPFVELVHGQPVAEQGK